MQEIKNGIDRTHLKLLQQIRADRLKDARLTEEGGLRPSPDNAGDNLRLLRTNVRSDRIS